MSDREFREIQLSGKQLVFLFISTVVVAVVIFLLGVAVGRGVRGTVGEAPLSASATVGDPATPVEASPTPATAELGYHDLLAGAGGTAATPPAGPPAASTESAPPPAPVAETPVAEPAPPAAGGWFLQVGAFSGRQAADGVVGSLKKLDVPAFVLAPGSGSPDRLFRVRVGPYVSQSDADAVRARLVREGFSARVTR